MIRMYVCMYHTMRTQKRTTRACCPPGPRDANLQTTYRYVYTRTSVGATPKKKKLFLRVFSQKLLAGVRASLRVVVGAWAKKKRNSSSWHWRLLYRDRELRRGAGRDGEPAESEKTSSRTYICTYVVVVLYVTGVARLVGQKIAVPAGTGRRIKK